MMSVFYVSLLKTIKMNNSIILSAKNISKSFSKEGESKTSVLQNISLDIFRGELLAILGASGAGKSTLLHIIGAIDLPDSGNIELFVDDSNPLIYNVLSENRLSELRNQHIGYIFQFHHLLPEFSALENVMMPALIAGKSAKKASVTALELLKKVDLVRKSANKPNQLSGGEQQRVAFARALVNNPALILADEPTGNLDSANSSLLIELIRQFRKESNQTFVLVTHSAELSSAADRTLVIKNGCFE